MVVCGCPDVIFSSPNVFSGRPTSETNSSLKIPSSFCCPLCFSFCHHLTYRRLRMSMSFVIRSGRSPV